MGPFLSKARPVLANGKARPDVSREERKMMMVGWWPGAVRQLEVVVHHCMRVPLIAVAVQGQCRLPTGVVRWKERGISPTGCSLCVCFCFCPVPVSFGMQKIGGGYFASTLGTYDRGRRGRLLHPPLLLPELPQSDTDRKRWPELRLRRQTPIE